MSSRGHFSDQSSRRPGATPKVGIAVSKKGQIEGERVDVPTVTVVFSDLGGHEAAVAGTLQRVCSRTVAQSSGQVAADDGTTLDNSDDAIGI